MFSRNQLRLAEDVVERCRTLNLRIAVAESCTGGLVAACLTAVAGASQVFDRGFVTYADTAKIQMLGVPEALLKAYGAVSEEVSRSMAEGALTHSAAGASIAITGIAGPSGATEKKPVGLVHIVVVRAGHGFAHRKCIFAGDRHLIRSLAVEAALSLMAESLST